jgi:hypothetical protein
MQELAGRFRENGLHIFRHRRGMLFVTSVYPRALPQDQEMSKQVRAILETIAAQPRIGRKELADKLIIDLAGEDAEKAKLALASDLKWLIDGGRVIEFNDGSLDLPRVKTPKPKEKEESSVAAGVSPANESKDVAPEMSAAEKEARVEAGAPPSDETVGLTMSAGTSEPARSEQTEPTEIGGS